MNGKKNDWGLIKEKDYENDPDRFTFKGWVVMVIILAIMTIFSVGLIDILKTLKLF